MSSHRKHQRIARALAAAQNIPYQQALALVIASSPTTSTSQTGFPQIADLLDPQGLIPIGVAADGQAFGFANRELDRHLLITGQDLAQRRELLKWIAMGIARDQGSLVIIAPDGHLSDQLLPLLLAACPERAQDIIICDLTDETWPIAFNPIDITDGETIATRVAVVMEMLTSLPSLVRAPQACNYLAEALTALCQANLALRDPDTTCTVLDIGQFFSDAEFRRLVMEFVSDPAVQDSFNPESGPFEQMDATEQQQVIAPIAQAIRLLDQSPLAHRLLSTSHNQLDFTQLITTESIMLVTLSRRPEEALVGQALGRLFLVWMLSQMDEWGRQRDHESGRYTINRLRCLIDQAQLLFDGNSSVIDMLAEMRKWDAGLVCSAPDLSAYPVEVRNGLLSNTAAKLTLTLSPDQAALIAGSLGSTAQAISGLATDELLINALVADKQQVRSSGSQLAQMLPPLDRLLAAADQHLNATALSNVHDRSRQISRRHEPDSAERAWAVETLKAEFGRLLRERIEATMDMYHLEPDQRHFGMTEE